MVSKSIAGSAIVIGSFVLLVFLEDEQAAIKPIIIAGKRMCL
jgi:hypothetical protein